MASRNHDTAVWTFTGLPVWITERVLDCRSGKRPDLSDAPPSTSSEDGHAPECVLYWLGTAMRGHENPALDVARNTAKRLKLPLVVASFLLYSHTFPTLRRFKYMLEGLQDTQQELRAQVIFPSFCLPDPLPCPTKEDFACWFGVRFVGMSCLLASSFSIAGSTSLGRPHVGLCA